MLAADFVTTEQGTGLVHIAPSHGADDFELGARHGLEVPDTVGEDGLYARRSAAVRRAARVQGGRARDRGAARQRRAAGARQAGAQLPALLALQGAADLSRDAAVVHPDGGARRAARQGAGRDRCDPLGAGAGPQPDPRHGREPARLVRLAPARLGRADRAVRRQGERRGAARSRGGRAHRRGLRAGGRGCLVHGRSGALPRPRPRSGRLRAGHGHRRGLVRFRLDPRHGARAARRPAVARLALSRGLRPAPRLVPELAPGELRHPRPGALRGGADARLRGRCRGAQDVEVARQRHLAARPDQDRRRRHPAPLDRAHRLQRGRAHRPGDPRRPGRRLPAAAQQPALSARQPRRLQRGRAGAARADAGAGALGAAPAGGARSAGARGQPATSRSPACTRRCTISAPRTCRPSTSTCARTCSTAIAPTACGAAPRAPCSTTCSIA